MSPSWPDVCAIIAAWQQAQLPGTLTVEVTLRLADGRQIPMPFVFPPVPAPQPSPGRPSREEEDWGPTSFQLEILDALEGKALKTDALGAAVGDRGRLYKAHGLQELRDRGLVKHRAGLGYYRPDALPPELQPQEE